MRYQEHVEKMKATWTEAYRKGFEDGVAAGCSVAQQCMKEEAEENKAREEEQRNLAR